jgi:hypothetical protein
MGQGNIVVHSHGEQRYRCQTCGHTFAATTGTPFDRVHTAADVVTIVLPWLGHGCPIPAIVAALGLDERTVAAWMPRAGRHGQQVHQHVVLQGQVDLQHVQADALWVKLVGRRVWMAIGPGGAVAAVARGGISSQRDVRLITTLVRLVRACGRSLAILVCVDGLASSVTAVLRVFREPVYTGRPGRPRLVLENGLLLGQMVKRYARRRVVSVESGGCGGFQPPSPRCWLLPTAARGSIRPPVSGATPPSVPPWRPWCDGDVPSPTPRRP